MLLHVYRRLGDDPERFRERPRRCAGGCGRHLQRQPGDRRNGPTGGEGLFDGHWAPHRGRERGDRDAHESQQ